MGRLLSAVALVAATAIYSALAAPQTGPEQPLEPPPAPNSVSVTIYPSGVASPDTNLNNAADGAEPGLTGTSSTQNTTTVPISEASVQSVAEKSTTCCQVLTNLLGDISFQTGDFYTNSLQSYWTQQAQSLKPACIVIPKSAKEVADAVVVLTTASKSIRGGCQFAVRSGGHTPWKGAANIQNGVTVDLSSLNQIIVSQDKSYVSIGSGNRWGDVYRQLDAQGLATSGGRVATVGVGGLVLGGGISFFSPRVGLVCDNVLSYEIVLASGQIALVNADSNPELFRALKGGSNNFGIVTRFDMKVFPQGNFWGGFLVSPIQTKDQYFTLFENFAKSSGYDPYAALINSYSYSPARGGWTIASNVEYTKPVVDAPPFKPFLALPQIANTMRISNLSDFAQELAGPTPASGRASFATLTFKNSAIMMSRFFDLANETALTLANVQDINFSLSFQPLPQAVLKPGFATTAGTGNVLGLSDADGDLVNGLLTVQWSNAADDEKISLASLELFKKAKTVSEELKVSSPYLYLNYAAEWQRPLAGYGGEQQEFLKKVSRDVDPGQVFQTLVPGGFKLNVQ